MVIISEESEEKKLIKDRISSLCYTTKMFHVLFVIINVFFLIFIPFQILVFGTPFQDAAQPGFPWVISLIFLCFCIGGLYYSFKNRNQLKAKELLTKNLLKMHKFNVVANLVFIGYLSAMVLSYYTVFVTVFNEISGFYLFMVPTTLVSLSIVILHFWIKSEECDQKYFFY